jgi:hypothetical protein
LNTLSGSLGTAKQAKNTAIQTKSQGSAISMPQIKKYIISNIFKTIKFLKGTLTRDFRPQVFFFIKQLS